MRCTPSVAAVLGLWVFGVAGVCAQSNGYDPKQVPTYDAGALTRQAEQAYRQSQLQKAAQLRAALPPAMVLTDSTVITANGFKFNGNKRLSQGQLAQVAAPFVDRPLAKLELHQLTDALSDAYRQMGWVVQVYIPRQELSGGELTLQVIETIPPSATP